MIEASQRGSSISALARLYIAELHFDRTRIDSRQRLRRKGLLDGR